MTTREIEESSKIRLPSVKVGIGTLFTIVVTGASLCAGVFWVYADKHNDEKYVPRAEHAKDLQILSQSVSEIKVSQKDMQTDIKELLKNSKK